MVGRCKLHTEKPLAPLGAWKPLTFLLGGLGANTTQLRRPGSVHNIKWFMVDDLNRQAQLLLHFLGVSNTLSTPQIHPSAAHISH